MQDEGPLLRLLFGPEPPAGAGRDDAQGIGLASPPEPPEAGSSPDVLAAIKRLLSAEAALRRAVREIGLEAVVQQLIEDHGRHAVTVAIKTKGRPLLHDVYYAVRHGLALVCEHHGCRGDRAAAEQLRPVFKNRYNDQRSTDAIYRRLKEARRRCAADPSLCATAERVAASWLEKTRGQPLLGALLAFNRGWTKSPPF
jgi:hypothetical protein